MNLLKMIMKFWRTKRPSITSNFVATRKTDEELFWQKIFLKKDKK